MSWRVSTCWRCTGPRQRRSHGEPRRRPAGSRPPRRGCCRSWRPTGGGPSTGARSFGNRVAHRHHLSVHTACAHVLLVRALRDDLPLTSAAAAAGDITIEHAQVLTNLAPTTEQRRVVLADPQSEVNEAFLVQQARLMPPDHLRTVLRRWAAYTDPDADDRGDVEACDREHLEVDRLHDMYLGRGQLTVDHGQARKAALQAITPVRAVGTTAPPPNAARRRRRTWRR